MSEMENPVDTVVRLLSQNMHVVKKDGSLASIVVSREWVDRELFKNVDGQVTVGLAESRDTKIEISGRLRRRVGSLRINVWSQDAYIRQKMVEEVNRIVRQNRNNPGGNISYLDVVSYRDVDRVDLKPFIYCTEFTLKSWSFEDIGGVF
ncbi:MAG: hypothetical protein ACPLZY_04685 [Candidatus Norongarragalinales archaeon]